MQPGVRKFVQDMAQIGFDLKVEADLIIFQIVPVGGAHDGLPVDTGVGTEELQPWPQVPPHWIHLPEKVGFPKTNSQASQKFGWLMHSRDLKGWGDAPPAVCWSSHVRAVLSEATA